LARTHEGFYDAPRGMGPRFKCMEAVMLTSAQIVPFLTHEDWVVREHAAERLKDEAERSGVTAGTALMVYDQFPGGLMNPFRSLAARLPATADDARTIATRLAAGGDEYLMDTLALALVGLSMEVIEAVGEELEKDKRLSEEVREHVWFRRKQLAHTPEELWKKLLEMGEMEDEAWKNRTRVPFSTISVQSVQMALARHREFTVPLVLEILNEASIEDSREIHAAQLAELLKLEESVPALVAKLAIDADYLRERVCDALAAIGTAEVVRQLAAFIPGKEWHVRLYAIGCLTRIMTPEAEEAILRLLENEDSVDLRTNLAFGLMLLGSEKGLETVQRMVETGEFDSFQARLDEGLYAAAVMLGRELPGAAELREKIELRRKEVNERTNLLLNENVLESLRKTMEKGYRLPGEPFQDEVTEPIVRTEAKMGRNDPCPCGSGKKFKKCCGK